MHRAVAVVSVVLLSLAACGSDDGGVSNADRDRLIEDLVVNANVEPEAAACAIDGQIEEFGARILDQNDTPTDADVEVLSELWQECGLFTP